MQHLASEDGMDENGLEEMRRSAAAELAEKEEARSRNWELAEAHAREYAAREHENHVRAGRAAAAKRWAGHTSAQETVARRVYRSDAELLSVFGGSAPVAIHRLIMATKGLLWDNRLGDGYPVPLDAFRRLADGVGRPAPGTASGLPAWCTGGKRKRRE